jgi:hypothetical protein
MIGTGIAKGLVQTAKNLIGTYTDKERLPTIEYPDERQTLPEASRQFPMLVFDGDEAMKGLRCTAQVHLHRQEQGQAGGLQGAEPVLPGHLRHRLLGLHELPDLRRGLPV